MKRRLGLIALLVWWAAMGIFALEGVEAPEGVERLEGFSIEPVSEALAARMRRGGSYPEGCPVPLSELRYVRVRHWNMEGKEMAGELVCNVLIAEDVRDIFEELYRVHYPIHSIRLIDDFGADDSASVAANNTSAFCYRRVAGTRLLSFHAKGLAVDVNPLDNPLVRPKVKGGAIPKVPHVIDERDACYRAFKRRGFSWGGHWRRLKDYQHFERREGQRPEGAMPGGQGRGGAMPGGQGPEGQRRGGRKNT